MFDGLNYLLLLITPLIGAVGMYAGGFWGVGCGWIVVPSMLLLGLSPMEAVGISLLQMIPSILPTVIKTYKDIGWGRRSLGRTLVIPLACGAFLGSFAGKPVNQKLNTLFGDRGLTILFAGIMIFIGIQTLRSRPAKSGCAAADYSYRQGMFAYLAGIAIGVRLHDKACNAGYDFNKSFALIAMIVVCSTLLKFFGYVQTSRYIMFIFATLLVVSLHAFGRYVTRKQKSSRTN